MSAIVATLFLAAVACAGCESPDGAGSGERHEARADRVDGAGETAPAPGPGESVKLFADEPFYRARSEPERQVRGVLSRVAVRTGPNTREHPLRLRTDKGEWGVYSEGLPSRLLDAIVSRPLIVTGKWIDLQSEGAAVEVWIGEVAPAQE